MRSEREAEGLRAGAPGWTTSEIGSPPFFVANRVLVSGGEIRWNGVVVDEAMLAKYVRLSSKLNPMPFVMFDPETGECAFATRVRDIIDGNYLCRDGARRQGTAEAFRKAPHRTKPGRPPA